MAEEWRVFWGQRAARRQERDPDQGLPTPRGQEEYALLVPEPKAGVLNLDHFPYQREPLYSDSIADEEEVVIMKATQVGVTTGLWRWALRRVDAFGETAIYYFPTDNHVTDFGDERIDPSIASSAYLRSRQTGVATKHLKQFGGGTLYLRGVKSDTAVQSVAADCLVFDEYDESDQKNIAQAERRLSGARASGRTPRVRRLGRPTLPGFGIAARFEASDQRLWLVTCPKCGTEQELTFADNLRWCSEAAGDQVLRAGEDVFEQEGDVTDVWRACAHCETRLDPEAFGETSPIHTGRWVPSKRGPGRVPGYHITRLIVPFTDLKAIVTGSRKTRPHEVEVFHWADLGMPFAAADAALTDLLVERACAEGLVPMDSYHGHEPTTMGVDVASERNLSVRVSEIGRDGKRRAISIREVGSFEELDELMVSYKIHICAIDSMPERRLAKAFASRWPGRVFLVSYDDSPRAMPWRLKLDEGEVHVNRTEAIDAMMDQIRNLTNLPLRTPPRKYVPQLTSPKRRTEEDSRGNVRRVYISTGSQGDDYAHAEVYDMVAQELIRNIGMAQGMDEQQERTIEPEEVGVRRRSMYDYDPALGG